MPSVRGSRPPGRGGWLPGGRPGALRRLRWPRPRHRQLSSFSPSPSPLAPTAFHREGHPGCDAGAGGGAPPRPQLRRHRAGKPLRLFIRARAPPRATNPPTRRLGGLPTSLKNFFMRHIDLFRLGHWFFSFFSLPDADLTLLRLFCLFSLPADHAGPDR
jgi:hypothetical protein